ncbi:[SSU ribosomal protein S18P]-alanine acetyltransferase [Jatrophihabitans endophyticus]|uniref:[Ribosomal protein bS18]-alanine N-acetyltransferase n=1 Tax=Jatrophihabitans endophyticus TaxID=1206085 RepID=A0A1M5GH75_9ACTN|nr:ribosomal protein S18-alanine N-acetyltransferase [Jatrophihabitans endophyticus]SHG02861.1 [SSU ribosomal protein S18P]-alanine acetyltransferase [Jatrophihabitans endophyticus]
MSTTVTLVPMTRAHIDLLLPHEREMFGTEAWSASSYRAELADTRLRHYVAAEDATGALLGWGGVMVVAESAEILTVGTVPAARRRGVGRLLLTALLAEAVRRGATEVFLEVRVDNDAALALYDGEGFARLGVRRGYYDAGRVDAVTMRKELPA